MSSTATQSLSYDPATVEFDSLLRRLNPTNTRPRWRELLERAETQSWSCREFLGRPDHRGDRAPPTDPYGMYGSATNALPRTRGQRAVVAQGRPAGSRTPPLRVSRSGTPA